MPSPQPAISARTVAGVTPGWSPSIRTSSSARGSSALRPAAIEDEQPSPKSGFSTTWASERSTRLRTSPELPPMRDDQLVEPARPRGLEGVVEEGARAVRQQLLRLAEPPGAARGEHETGDERLSAPRHPERPGR